VFVLLKAHTGMLLPGARWYVERTICVGIRSVQIWHACRATPHATRFLTLATRENEPT